VNRTSVVSTSFLHALRLGPPVHLCFCTYHRWPRTIFVSSYKILRPKQDMPKLKKMGQKLRSLTQTTRCSSLSNSCEPK
jgi:hypothetical protein